MNGKQLRERRFTNEKGEMIVQYIDNDGVIIDELREQVRLVPTEQHEEEEYGYEESLGRNPEHIKLYRTNVQYILSKFDLSKDARCAFLSCISYVDWNSNFVVDPVTKEPLSGREIAEKTNLDRNTMQRGLKELQKHGIVAVMSSGAGKAQHYVVHTSLAWKGKRVAKDIAQVNHFKKNGLQLPLEVKYSQGMKSQ